VEILGKLQGVALVEAMTILGRLPAVALVAAMTTATLVQNAAQHHLATAIPVIFVTQVPLCPRDGVLKAKISVRAIAEVLGARTVQKLSGLGRLPTLVMV